MKFLALAIDEWIKTQVFFPAVSELREIAARKARYTREEIARLQRERAERDRRNIKRPTPEQMEAIRAEIAEKWGATRTARPRASVSPRDVTREEMASRRATRREEINARIPPNEA